MHGAHAELAVLCSGAPLHGALNGPVLPCGLPGRPQLGAQLGVLHRPGRALAGAPDGHSKELQAGTEGALVSIWITPSRVLHALRTDGLQGVACREAFLCNETLTASPLPCGGQESA